MICDNCEIDETSDYCKTCNTIYEMDYYITKSIDNIVVGKQLDDKKYICLAGRFSSNEVHLKYYNMSSEIKVEIQDIIDIDMINWRKMSNKERNDFLERIIDNFIFT